MGWEHRTRIKKHTNACTSLVALSIRCRKPSVTEFVLVPEIALCSFSHDTRLALRLLVTANSRPPRTTDVTRYMVNDTT